MEYIVRQTIGYGNTINTLYCREEVAKKFDYDVPDFVCGNRIELNRFLDNFIQKDYELFTVYEGRYEPAYIIYSNNEFTLKYRSKTYIAIGWNQLISLMNDLDIRWNEKY